MRNISKFMDIANKIVKSDMIKCSVDFLRSNDYEMANIVFEELDVVTNITLHSDKCGPREYLKLTDDYAKELVKPKGSANPKIVLKRYIKEIADDDDDFDDPDSAD